MQVDEAKQKEVMKDLLGDTSDSTEKSKKE
jgi:hypothetical protein